MAAKLNYKLRLQECGTGKPDKYDTSKTGVSNYA